MNIPPKWLPAMIVAFILLPIGIIWFGIQEAKKTAIDLARAEQRAETAQHQADSMKIVLEVRVRKAQEDSIRAADAERATRLANAAAAKARRQRDSLAAQVAVLSDTSVLLEGDSVPTPIPAAVGRLLHADQATIEEQNTALGRLGVALDIQKQATASEHLARLGAEDRVAKLEEVNRATADQVKALTPPACGRTCGIVIGAASMVGAALLLHAATK